jgi:hypothetical protein
MRKKSSDFETNVQSKIMNDVEQGVGYNNLCRIRKDIRIERSSAILHALFPAVRQRLLRATLTQPDRWWYLSELAHDLGTKPSSLQRELPSLVNAGILEQRRRGARIYFKANRSSPTFSDLRGIFERTQKTVFSHREVPLSALMSDTPQTVEILRVRRASLSRPLPVNGDEPSTREKGSGAKVGNGNEGLIAPAQDVQIKEKEMSMRLTNKKTIQLSQPDRVGSSRSALEYVPESTAMPVDTGRVEVQTTAGSMRNRVSIKQDNPTEAAPHHERGLEAQRPWIKIRPQRAAATQAATQAVQPEDATRVVEVPGPEQEKIARAITKLTEHASKFTDVVRDLLLESPKRFKELYPLIAERQPQDCPAIQSTRGTTVSIARMEWLREIEQVLQEIAINRRGLWHLKEIRCEFPNNPVKHNGKSELLKHNPSSDAVVKCDPVGIGRPKRIHGASRTAWKHCDVFPIIASVIEQLFKQHRQFITAREISANLLLNSEGRTFVAAALAARTQQKSPELEADNMVNWFSAQITSVVSAK